MQLDPSYDLYFENKGRCPECGEWLVPHIGCIGPIVEWEKKKEIKCSIRELSKKNYRGVVLLSAIVSKYKKILSYKHVRRNLDIQPEKSYFKAND
jgi:hypothetical protein